MTRLPMMSKFGLEPTPGDDYLEHGLNVPITSRPAWIYTRAIALLTGALISAWLSDLPHRALVVGVLAGAACLQPLIPMMFRRRNATAFQAATDFVVGAIVVLAAPVLWAPVMVWLGATIVWQAIASPTRIAVPLAAFAIAVVSITGFLGDVRYWWTAAVLMVTMGMSFAVFGRQLRQEFRESEQSLMITLAKAGAIAHHTDLASSSVSQVTGDIEVLTGWTSEEWCGLDHRRLLHPDDFERFWVEVDDVHDGMLLDRTGRMRRPDGSWVWVRDISRVSIDRGGVRSLRGFSLDVSELEEANRTIAAQARLDTLTGLPNRLALNEQLDTYLASDGDFALLMIDLDRFKEVNDTLGHEAGDRLLAIVADRIGHAVSDEDFLARLGGDEFAIIVPGAFRDRDVAELIERVTFECAQPVSVHGVRLATSLSIGVAYGNRSDADRASVMRHADIAMYDAKRRGVSYRSFDASLEQTSTTRLTLSATLPDAIAAGEFQLHFQPKIDLMTREVVGAEGLARWLHPEHGLLSPAAFLEVATMSESAGVFGRTMIEQGVEMAARLAAVGAPLPISVNITMRALQADDFSSWLFAALGRRGVPPRSLILELTEREVQDPSSQVAATIQELTEAGIELSIDDFGTGHSSMQRLRDLNVDELKIDRSFVDGVVASSIDREIVGSIIALANRLGYRVVAEGVEDETHAAALLDLGCVAAQGYLFSDAIPAEEFLELAQVAGALRRS